MMIKAIKHLAQSLGITQPRWSNLKCGRIDLFSLDTLLNMAEQAGLAPSIKVKALPKVNFKRALLFALCQHSTNCQK
jgi:Helix-turn-helix domain